MEPPEKRNCADTVPVAAISKHQWEGTAKLRGSVRSLYTAVLGLNLTAVKKVDPQKSIFFK